MPVRLRSWSYARQQLGRTASGPDEALRYVVAVYSSHPTAPLALQSRSVTFDAASLARMEEARQVLRLPAMRGSIFLMSAETAPRIMAATRMPLEKLAGRLRYAGLDWNTYALLKRRIPEFATEPVTANALQEAFGAEEDVKVMTAVRIMTYEGLMLRLGTSLRSDNLRYVSTEAWLGQPLEEANPDESLRWLAQEYLRSYGPARVEDFAWWGGVTRRRAAATLNDPNVVDLGDGLLLPSDLQAAFNAVEPIAPDTLAVIPKWDAYTMGYAPDGRQRLVNDEHRSLAYTTSGGTSGDGKPLVLRGGRAVASWSHRFNGNRMLVTVEPFEPDGLPHSLYEHAFDEAGTLLGAVAVEVVSVPSAR